MLTGLGIVLMIAMMGGMMLGGHKMMKGGGKGAAQAPVSVSSAAAPGAEPAEEAHRH
jgi:hypothetical protein